MSSAAQISWDDQPQIKWDDAKVPGAPNGLPAVPAAPNPILGENIVHRDRMIPGPGGGFPQSYAMPEKEVQEGQNNVNTILGTAGVGAGLATAPMATIGSIAGSYGLGKGAKYGTKAMGGGETAQDIAEFGGNVVGGVGGGTVGEAMPETSEVGNFLASKLRNPATARQSQLGKPGTIRSILPPTMQRWTLPDWAIPTGEVGTPTNPGKFMEIPARAPKTAPSMWGEKPPSIRDAAAEARPSSEGRPATWTNEKVRELAAWGDPDATEQSQLRGFGRIPLKFSTVESSPMSPSRQAALQEFLSARSGGATERRITPGSAPKGIERRQLSEPEIQEIVRTKGAKGAMQTPVFDSIRDDVLKKWQDAENEKGAQ